MVAQQMTTGSLAGGPAELVLAAAVARRHYLHEQSKVEIADALGVSRFKVARLLDVAREQGLVRIDIVEPAGIDTDLSAQVQQCLGLRRVVVTTDDSHPRSADRTAAAGAALLSELIQDNDILGLPWSRSVAAMLGELASLPPVEVVQLCGALQLPGQDASTVDVVTRAASLAGGKRHVFYSPLVLASAQSAADLRAHPAIADALRHVARVSVAVVGIGSWTKDGSTIREVIPQKTAQEVARQGAVGEIAGVFFDAHGETIDTALTERIVTMTGPQLRGIPEVIALADGAHKAPAIAAASAGGLISSLVTTRETARALLSGRP